MSIIPLQCSKVGSERMKVKIVFDISDDDRRNINNYWNSSGRSAKASHADVKDFIQLQINTLLEGLIMDDDQSDLDVEGEQRGVRL